MENNDMEKNSELEEEKNLDVSKNEESDVDSEENELLGLSNESFTYKIDNNNINNDYNKNNDDKTIMYVLIGVVILVFIIISLILFVNKGNDKTSSYSDVESRMVSAAKNYYKKNPQLLPINESLSISTETLIQESFLKPFSEMVDDGVSCTGYVNVFNVDDNYAYFPYLNCGNDYQSLKLSDKIISDNLVSSGDGLYKLDDSFIFKGEYPNNFVKFSGKLWRIIGLNSDGSLRLIYADKKTDKVVWDDRYNNEKDSYVGINDFRVSRLLEYLKKIYNENTYIEKSNRVYLIKHDWCIGKISVDDQPISGLNLCSDVYDDLYIGIVNVTDVLLGSLDSNCKNIYDISCTNYNYFYEINTGWTLNASNNNTYGVFNSGSGTVSFKNAYNNSVIRPVINLNSNILYKSGDGTSDSPYVIGD